MEVQWTTDAIWLQPAAKPTGFQMPSHILVGMTRPAAKAPSLVFRCVTFLDFWEGKGT